MSEPKTLRVTKFYYDVERLDNGFILNAYGLHYNGFPTQSERLYSIHRYYATEDQCHAVARATASTILGTMMVKP